MKVMLDAIFSTPFIGLYGANSEKCALVSGGFNRKNNLDKLSEVLGSKIVIARVADSELLGLFLSMNSNGVLMPKMAEKKIDVDVPVGMVDDRLTALGNLILANDNGAIISPYFTKNSEKVIQETLGVQVVRGKIAGLEVVGSCGLATNKGALLHPDARDDEIKLVERMLKVKVITGTLCRGNPYVGTCGMANSNGAVIGSNTTPIEVTNLEDALG